MTTTTDNTTIHALLGRDPFTPSPRIGEHFIGNTILVTGAGGSIGSEICRALSPYPCIIVAYDRSETNLTRLISESKKENWIATLAPFLGDITQPGLLDSAFRQHSPGTVIHAAAYKHLPLLEMFPVQAIENNVIGTRNVLSLAVRHKARRFVLISTDKAVKPSSVMGCSKRLAEIATLDPAAVAGSDTRPVIVRLGNVLGSSGSVLPLFESQIAAGGPITVTHPDATRFFMSIPEAANLILTAAVISGGWETLVLDMGKPVNIADIARKLAALRGRPDIKIVCTGLRPGEKLTEELFTGETIPTSHERIWRVDNSAEWDLRWDGLLEYAVRRRDTKLVLWYMKDMIPEYRP